MRGVEKRKRKEDVVLVLTRDWWYGIECEHVSSTAGFGGGTMKRWEMSELMNLCLLKTDFSSNLHKFDG